MGVETQERTELSTPFTARWSWQSGAVAGCLATVVMGLATMAGDLAVLRDAVAGLYTFEGSLVAGWLAHLAHGTLFGLVFALVLSDPGLYRVTDWAWKTVLAGVVYGFVLGGAYTAFDRRWEA